MADYTGSRCIVCTEQFKEDDDIVVCPECGTPYHRECYAKSGKCLNTELHRTHRTWKPSSDVGDGLGGAVGEENICRVCGCVNTQTALFCSRCGNPMPALERHNEEIREKQSAAMNGNPYFGGGEEKNGGGINVRPFLINFSDPLCGYNPDEDFDGVRLCELGDYVETNTHYYLPIFKRIKETSRAISWNFSAMLFPELYFAYRKMPLVALGAFIVRAVSRLPMYISVLAQGNIMYLSELAQNFDLRSTAFQAMNMLSYVLTYALMFFCGSFANRIYYKHSVRKTAKIKAAVPPQNLRQTLRRKGGTSALWLVLFIILYILPVSAIYLLSYMEIYTAL